ncbi:MAG: hypothetical protein WC184_02815 [Acidimicrobiia bacterium]
MRVIALRIGDQQVDLHPGVTVLTGLVPAQQNYVVASLARMLNGDGKAVEGQFECHQLIGDITPENVDALALPSGLAVVVRAEELPGSSLGQYEPAFEVRINELRAALDAAYHESSELDLRGDQARQLTQSASAELEAALAQLDTAAPANMAEAQARLEALMTERERQARAQAGVSTTNVDEVESALEKLVERVEALNVTLEHDRLALLEQFESLEDKQRLLDDLLLPDLSLDDLSLPLDTSDSNSSKDETQSAELVETVKSDLEPPTASELDQNHEPEEITAWLGTGVLNDGAVVAGRFTEEELEELEGLVDAAEGYAPSVDMVPNPEAAALADRWDHLERAQAKLRVELKSQGLDLGDLEAQIADAQTRIEAIDKQTRRTQVPPELEAEIERLYEAIDDTQGRRFGRRSKRNSQQAREELDAALAQAGFPTYAAYVMGRVAPTINHAALERLAAAQEQLEKLQSERDEIAAQLEQDQRVQALRADHAEIRRAACELLSEPEVDHAIATDSLTATLRALLIENPLAAKEPNPVDVLKQRLVELNVDFDTESPETKTLLLAANQAINAARMEKLASLAKKSPAQEPSAVKSPAQEPPPKEPLARQSSAKNAPELIVKNPQVAALQAEIDQLQNEIIVADADLVANEELQDELLEEIAKAEAELDELRQNGDPAAGLVVKLWDDDVAVQQAMNELSRAKARLETHEAAKANMQEAEDRLQQARRAESMNLTVKRSADEKRQRLERELDEVLERAPLPTVVWHNDGNLPGEIEWYLLGKVSALRKASFVGSIPLVINDAFRGLDKATVDQLGAALNKVSDTSQVIYVGNSPEVVAWAAAQPIESAALVEV